MHIGLDFGTTNSGAAVFDGTHVHVLPLDRASQDARVVRSTLYITRDHQVLIGREAIDTYYQQNVGRPSRMVRQRVGEVEITTGDVGSVKGYPVGPTTFVQDVYALVDELTPGRLLHSLKSGLATGYAGTTLFGRAYTLEDLIALYLRALRQRVEEQTGQTVEGVVLGRPVHFVDSRNTADDHRAEARLRQAALAAGFKEVACELEPVAAALFYERTVDRPQNVVVFDLGGGTLDITVMRVGEAVERQVLATGGIDVAGESFDKRIIAGRLLEHFGQGSTWGPDQLPFPRRYTDALLNWQAVPELLDPEMLHFLQTARATSSHPQQLRALESLLVNNYAIRLFDEVERVKIALSSTYFDVIQLRGEDVPDIDLWQPLTRLQFQALIAADMHRIETCLRETLEQSGLSAAGIDVVVRTGGSAQIPCLVALLERMFGREKVLLADVFSSVAAGLAIRAGIGAGCWPKSIV